MEMLNNWHTKAIDFDQSYTQEDCDTGMCLHLLAGFHIKNKDRCIIKLIKNLCGLREGGCNFYEKLKSELEKRGHIQSAADQCAFYKNVMIVLYYFDDFLLFAQTRESNDELFASLKEDFSAPMKANQMDTLTLKLKPPMMC